VLVFRLGLVDISALPSDVRDAARIDANGEVSWPDEYAARAIEALTAAGHRLLGLDIRFYVTDGTFYEIAWSSSEASADEAKVDALKALSRTDELERPDDAVERRVLITWD
jgi:CHASE2 domain-containing sensor protein